MSDIPTGTYVLATKYSDGDPRDHWVIGFYDRLEGGRHYVLDGDGKQMRGNGFRRVQPIESEVGAWLLGKMREAEKGDAGVWDYWLPAALEATKATTP